MLIRIRRASDVPEREVTDPALYQRRREFLRSTALIAGAAAVGGALPACAPAQDANAAPVPDSGAPRALEARTTAYTLDEPATREKDATRYNNFYEFGSDKDDPARNAGSLVTEPWSVTISGAAGKPGAVGLEDLLAAHAPEERVYRLRCVEAWSMVIPWIGIPLRDVLARFEPAPDARFVEFRTLSDAEQMPGLRRNVLDWPYREGLRMDEAMHPLALLAVGMYGKVLPNQNGAPLRLVVPWKYGFKSIKSIVSIRFASKRPATSWNMSAPREYGFYSNVNPEVDHPRWSQARERRIGDFRRRPTLPFNGYGEEVASLYAGMDLRKSF